MAKPRTCPCCYDSIPLGEGYRFDEQMNMVCDRCGKIIFAADPASESTPLKSNYPPQPQPYSAEEEVD